MDFELVEVRRLRVLDFDIECRPLSWYGGDWVTREITAIGAQFATEFNGHCWLLGEDDPKEMLEGFRQLWEQADIVVGHYIRGFDIPVIQSAMVDYKLPSLTDKLTQDTKLDLLRFSGLSKSQENLGALLGLDAPKIQMDQEKWREANRLTSAGLELTRKRVLGDVRQNIELRNKLLELGYLGPPKLWQPGATTSKYLP